MPPSGSCGGGITANKFMPFTCPKCGSQAAVMENVVGPLNWGPAVIGSDAEEPVLTAGDSSPLWAWAICESCTHEWRLQQPFDTTDQPEEAP